MRKNLVKNRFASIYPRYKLKLNLIYVFYKENVGNDSFASTSQQESLIFCFESFYVDFFHL